MNSPLAIVIATFSPRSSLTTMRFAARRARRRHHSFSRHVPDRPDRVQFGVFGEQRACRLLRVAGEVRAADTLLAEDLDVRIVLGDRLLKAVIALLGDKEVSGMENKSDLAFAAERPGHQVGAAMPLP